ncbi:GNAT family N-acetyltransferase [Methanosarcina vacuolata]|uniref:GCN5-related N-acetyltransferase n=1 Tax=Methanosarcina vacuolata Z-761 TaxID=1434123 RepID=A0A0E3LGI7_9EURY|nr:GNAT family N-acetyltransferase [Methanosarcina vacuolata]AKB42591.1 GCN5-related N-acetyltransferase [Methanosarcina vacuolata Z-761]
MREICIRKARNSDLLAIQRLLSTYFLDMEGLAPEDFVLAEIDGKITGCAALIKSEFHGKNFLEIHSIAVHPNFRGKGVGTRLVKYLLTTTGDSCCDLYVRTTAPIFFEKLDFKKVENSEKLSLWKDCKNCEHFEKCTQHAMKYSYK